MLPIARVIQVDTRGAVILQEGSPEVRHGINETKVVVVDLTCRTRQEIVVEYTFQTTQKQSLILRSMYVALSLWFNRLRLESLFPDWGLSSQSYLLHAFTSSPAICSFGFWKPKLLFRVSVDAI